MRTVFFPAACIFLAASLAFCSGCTAPDPMAGGSQGASLPVTASPVQVTPAEISTTLQAAPSPESVTAQPGREITVQPSVEPVAAVTTLPVSPTPVPSPTWIQKSPVADSIDDPQIVGFTYKKEALPFEIPNCGMLDAFPAVAGEPAYGILQPEVRLILVDPGEVSAFLRANAGEHRDDPNPAYWVDASLIGGAACSGTIASPTWNFARFNGTLVPRNAKPAVYDIGINVRSHGRIITQLRITEKLELDHPVEITRYIPIMTREAEAFDTMDLVFAKRA
ncbi:MAG: hypothetical protein GYA23_02940 [Methanomicrobiales archaeon]|nr:hypothetical protein [Methanomicrobiales archaeon]